MMSARLIQINKFFLSSQFFPYDRIYDFRDNSLSDNISKATKTSYLALCNKITLGKSIKGIVYGPNLRPIVSLPTKLVGSEKYRWVHFIIDSGANMSFFDESLIQTLFADSQKQFTGNNSYRLDINGFMIQGPIGFGDLKKINLLGQDFLQRHSIKFFNKPSEGECQLVIDYKAWLKRQYEKTIKEQKSQECL